MKNFEQPSLNTPDQQRSGQEAPRAHPERELFTSILQRIIQEFAPSARRTGKMAALTALLRLTSLGADAVYGAPLPPILSEHESDSATVEREATPNDLHRLLSHLKSLGYSLTATAGITVDIDSSDRAVQEVGGGMDTHLFHYFKDTKTRDEQEIKLFHAVTPIHQLLLRDAVAAETPAALRGHKEEPSIPVPALALEYAHIAGATAVEVIVRNWVTKQVVYRGVWDFHPQRQKGATYEEYSRAFLRGLGGALRKEVADLSIIQKVLDTVPAIPLRAGWEPTYRAVDRTKPNATQEKILKNIVTQWDDVSLSSIPRGGEVRRSVQILQLYTKDIALKITPDMVGALHGKMLGVNGQVTKIELCRPAKAKGLGPLEETSKSFKDSYGNHVSAMVFRDRTTATTGNEYISIRIPNHFAQSKSEDPTITIAVDLSAMGMGTIEFAQGKKEIPCAKAGARDQYTVYTNFRDDALVRNNHEAFKRIAQGIERAEELFGSLPGGSIRHLYLVNEKGPNAFVQDLNPDTVSVQAALLKLPAESQETTGFHEAIHALDEQLAISQTGLKEYHISLLSRKDFCDAINESAFYEDQSGFGGHANDNEKEFLSSFLNSTIHPHWGERIGVLSQKNQENYAKCLDVTIAALVSNPKVSPKAPIIQHLSKLRAVLPPKE